MKKSLIAACLLSVCTVYSFAQTPADIAGAKLVADHDAAYAKAHTAADVKGPMPSTRHSVTHKPRKSIHRATKKVTKVTK